MHARITKSFSFDAAHWLPQVPENHKCRRLHGHTYRVILGLEGDLHPEMGWVEDYNVVAAAMQPVREELDHRCLNEIPGLENPTAEILAAWIHDRLCASLPQLTDVTVCETPTTEATYRNHP
ncbi:6-carboxytetrahydropterin synthase QueD [bacterium]|nr:MAG: 6-carboxytetrahydropterin synthase QueD [bacterium]